MVGSAVPFWVAVAGWWGRTMSLAGLWLARVVVDVSKVPSETRGPGFGRVSGVGGVVVAGGREREIVTANEWRECCDML